MSSLFSKHISGFFLLLGKTEVLPKALAHLLNLPDTLLCPILCSPATWPSPALSRPRAFVHDTLTVCNVYAFFGSQRHDHF